MYSIWTTEKSSSKPSEQRFPNRKYKKIVRLASGNGAFSSERFLKSQLNEKYIIYKAGWGCPL